MSPEISLPSTAASSSIDPSKTNSTGVDNYLPSCKTEASPAVSLKSSPAVNLKSFTLNDLKNATKNFSSNSYLGEGGFGCVFKGWIDENTFVPTRPGVGIVVAIKKLKRESFQGHKEWLVCSPNT